MTNPEPRTLSACSNPLRFEGTAGFAAQESNEVPVGVQGRLLDDGILETPGHLNPTVGLLLALRGGGRL